MYWSHSLLVPGLWFDSRIIEYKSLIDHFLSSGCRLLHGPFAAHPFLESQRQVGVLRRCCGLHRISGVYRCGFAGFGPSGFGDQAPAGALDSIVDNRRSQTAAHAWMPVRSVWLSRDPCTAPIPSHSAVSRHLLQSWDHWFAKPWTIYLVRVVHRSSTILLYCFRYSLTSLNDCGSQLQTYLFLP